MPHRDAHQLGPLLERSRQGDRDAWDRLLGHLRPYLKALVRSWLGPELTRRLGESDIVQDVLLRIERDFANHRGQSVPELLGWVKTIAYRATVDGRRQAISDRQAGSDFWQSLPTAAPSPSEVLAGEEDAVRLATALEQLSEARRDVIHARLFEQQPFAEIARSTGQSAGALRVLFVRAVRQLREILEAVP